MKIIDDIHINLKSFKLPVRAILNKIIINYIFLTELFDLFIVK
jgi:hypothetical protein